MHLCNSDILFSYYQVEYKLLYQFIPTQVHSKFSVDTGIFLSPFECSMLFYGIKAGPRANGQETQSSYLDHFYLPATDLSHRSCWHNLVAICLTSMHRWQKMGSIAPAEIVAVEKGSKWTWEKVLLGTYEKCARARLLSVLRKEAPGDLGIPYLRILWGCARIGEWVVDEQAREYLDRISVS